MISTILQIHQRLMTWINFVLMGVGHILDSHRAADKGDWLGMQRDKHGVLVLLSVERCGVGGER